MRKSKFNSCCPLKYINKVNCHHNLTKKIGPPINHLVEKITLITENDQMYWSSVFTLDRSVAMNVCMYVCMYVCDLITQKILIRSL